MTSKNYLVRLVCDEYGSGYDEVLLNLDLPAINFEVEGEMVDARDSIVERLLEVLKGSGGISKMIVPFYTWFMKLGGKYKFTI